MAWWKFVERVRGGELERESSLTKKTVSALSIVDISNN